MHTSKAEPSMMKGIYMQVSNSEISLHICVILLYTYDYVCKWELKVRCKFELYAITSIVH